MIEENCGEGKGLRWLVLNGQYDCGKELGCGELKRAVEGMAGSNVGDIVCENGCGRQLGGVKVSDGVSVVMSSGLKHGGR